VSFIAGSTCEKGDRYSDGLYSGFAGLLVLLLLLGLLALLLLLPLLALLLAVLLLELGLLCARTGRLTDSCMHGWQCWHVPCCEKARAAFDLECSSILPEHTEQRLSGSDHVFRHSKNANLSV
jgi:hypothetical protein